MIQWMCEMEPSGHSFCPYHSPPCTLEECVEASVVAGSDIADGDEYKNAMANAVINGNITLGDAQQRLFNTLLIRFRLGLFDPVDDQPYLKYGENEIATPSARADNALAARQALVLLQHGDLPFARGQAGATLVVGFCGNSTGSLVSNYVNQFCADGSSHCFPSLLEAISSLGEETLFSRGCESPTTCPDAEVTAAVTAVGLSGTSRVVLCLGISQSEEGEQKDRVNITLPAQQSAMFSSVAAAAAGAGKPFAVVLVHGGALAVPEVKTSGAGIVDAFYPGPEGGGAIADALFGIYNPGGKLPYTVYGASYTQALDMADMRIAETGRTYRYNSPTLAPGGEPLWRFGFGLSYTNFSLAYSGASPLLLTPAEPTTVLPVHVTNTGGREGDEVLQLYVSPNAATLSPPAPPYVPVRFLIFFHRLRLQAGEGGDVSVSLNAQMLNLTLSDGTQGPINGNYSLIFSRGIGVGEEISIPLKLQGF